MPIRFIDPNNRVVYDPENNTTQFIGLDQIHETNGYPQSEELYIYAEFTATRRESSSIVADDPANDANFATGKGFTVNFLGHNQKGENEDYFTTFDGNQFAQLEEDKFNGFGIDSITVNTNVGYITTVNISFIDARKGESLKNSPYDILLSTLPSALYNLKVKGFYGRCVEYQLLLQEVPSVSFDPSNGGYMRVEAKFVSNSWKPLGDIMLYDLYALPFLKSNPNNVGNNIVLNANQPPKTFYEFILRSKKFYDDVVELKDLSIDYERINEIKKQQSKITTILDYGENYLDRINPIIEKNDPNITSERFYTDKDKRYLFTRSTSSSKNVEIALINDYNIFKNRVNDNTLLSNIGIDDVSILGITVAGNITRVSFFEYYNLVKTYEESLQTELDNASKSVANAINDTLDQRFGKGFRPTVGNVMKLLCDDIDTYFKILRDTSESAEKYHSIKTPPLDNGNGGVDFVQSFPTYSRKEPSTTTAGLNRLVKTYPFDQPAWYETKLINDFFEAYVYKDVIDNKIDQARKLGLENIEATPTDISNAKTNIQFDAAKTEIYYNIKRQVDKYIKPLPQDSRRFAYPQNGDTPLFDKFKFVDRAYNDISQECILDFTMLADMDLTNTTVWSLIDLLMGRNGFRLFPFQNFMLYNQSTWEDAFLPNDCSGMDSTPLFVAQYIGGSSESANNVNDDSFDISNPKKLPPDYSTSQDVFAFRVGYGEQNQSYFKSVEVSTNEHTTTRESFQLTDDISRRGGKSIPVLQGQSLYDIYETYSYTATISMLGCMSIQPTQYFLLENVPIFSGTYMITDITHTFSPPSNCETVFKGVRVGRYVKPLVKNMVQTVDILYDRIKGDNISSTGLLERKNARALVRENEFEYRDNASVVAEFRIENTETVTDYFRVISPPLANAGTYIDIGLDDEIQIKLDNFSLPPYVLDVNDFY